MKKQSHTFSYIGTILSSVIILGSLFFHFQSSAAQNYVRIYAEMGHLPTVKTMGGIGGIYKHTFKSNWEVGGGLHLSNRYPDFFGAMAGYGAYRFAIGKVKFRVDDMLIYRSFGSYSLHELNNGLLLGWESKHVSARIGNAFQWIIASDASAFDGWLPLFEGKLNLKGDLNPWDAGVFVRNFDDFAVDGLTTVRWGANGRIRIKPQMSALIEAVLQTAGNANATASMYGWYIKIGGCYTW